MNITDVRIWLANKEEGKLKAIAAITIDNEFAVHDIRIIDGRDGLFILMPNRKNAKGEFVDICHPISTPVRENITKIVLDAYNKAVAESNNQ